VLTAASKPTVAAPVFAKGPPRPALPKEEPAPPPKPVDACDLACQMQRAVNKKK
jgi:hypothetical protein